MVVVTANWLFSDGSVVDSCDREPESRFLETLRGVARRAGVREDGTYAPLERLDVVFAGDTFDWLVSERWLGTPRPWHGGRPAGELLARVVVDSIAAARPLLGALHRLARDGLCVPAADPRGRPARAAAIVPVFITMLPGDRDFQLAANLLHDGGGRPSIAVGSSWERIDPRGDGIAVRHGHECDPLCFGGDTGESRLGRRDRPPTLAESLYVDLLAAFLVRLRGAALPADRRRRFVRSILRGHLVDLPSLIGDAIATECTAASLSRDVVAAWRRSVDQWHRIARAEPPASPTGFDAVDALAGWMQAIRPAAGASLHPAPRCAEGWLETRPRDLRPTPADRRRIVLGHPPADLSDGTSLGVVALGGIRVGRVSSWAYDARDVHEVAVERPPADDDPAWVAIPSGCGHPVVTSPGLRLGAA